MAGEARAAVRERTIKTDALFAEGEHVELDIEFGSTEVQQERVFATRVKNTSGDLVWSVSGAVGGTYHHDHNRMAMHEANFSGGTSERRSGGRHGVP